MLPSACSQPTDKPVPVHHQYDLAKLENMLLFFLLIQGYPYILVLSSGLAVFIA